MGTWQHAVCLKTAGRSKTPQNAAHPMKNVKAIPHNDSEMR